MKVGVIGAGKIAERHITAYKKLGVKNIKVTDSDRSTAIKIADKFKIELADRTDDLMSDSSITIVDICTPVSSHKDIVISSLKNDKHVFCEKPLCSNLDEAYQIKKAVTDSRKMLMVGYLYRYHPAFVRVKEWLEAGLIGTPHFGIFRIGGRGNHQEWKHSLKNGGGAINEMLIHKLDLVSWYFGDVRKVTTFAKDTLLKERMINGRQVRVDAEDIVLLELQYDGARIICEADFLSPVYMEYLEIHGDNGSIFTSILDHFPTILYLKEKRGAYEQGNNISKFEQVNLFELELSHFLDLVRNGKQDMNSINDSIRVSEIIEKLRQG